MGYGTGCKFLRIWCWGGGGECVQVLVRPLAGIISSVLEPDLLSGFVSVAVISGWVPVDVLTPKSWRAVNNVCHPFNLLFLAVC